MLGTFNTSATTESTLGNANWNGGVGDIRESIRRINEISKQYASKKDTGTADLIIFTPEAFSEIERHLSTPGTRCKPVETIVGIKLEIVAGDTPAMLQAMRKACLGERVILVTKGEVGLCVREYSDQFSTEEMQAASDPRYMFQEVGYNAGLASCFVPVPIPHNPFIAPDEPIQFNPKW